MPTTTAVEIDRTVGQQIVLSATGLTAAGGEGVRVLDDVSFSLYQGEILGVAGVAGNGQQELAEALLGIRALTAGRVTLDGVDISGRKTAELLEMGMAYVPEDRQQDGFLPKATVAHNLLLGSQRRREYPETGPAELARGLQAFGPTDRRLQYPRPGPKDTAANLSGGNIQRVMLARAFARTPRLLILHNPTSGLDIASVEGVYNRLLAYKAEGVATLLLSDDLDELMLLSDRMAVVFRGAIVGILNRGAYDTYEIGRLMAGTASDG